MQQYGNHKRTSIHPHNECSICDEKNKVSKKKARQLGKKEIEEAIKEISEICIELGCSGLNDKCPGNVHCDIIQKIFIKEKR